MPGNRSALLVRSAAPGTVRFRALAGIVATAIVLGLVAVPAARAAVVSPPGTFISVGAGRQFVCAVRTDQTLFCWGANEYGQATPPAGHFVSVSAGDAHACAIRTDSALICWGASDPAIGSLAVPPPGSFTAVSAGFLDSCAIRTDQTLACWGYDTQLGQLSGSVPPGTFTAVDTRGNDSACAIRTDQTGVCWGNNALGQGNVPQGTWMSIAGGDGSACGVQAGGTLLCWGSTSVKPVPAGSFTSVTDSGDYACAIRSDQTLTCWGTNFKGVSPDPLGAFTFVNAGTFFPCAIHTDQTLTCWGTFAPALPAGAQGTPAGGSGSAGSSGSGAGSKSSAGSGSGSTSPAPKSTAKAISPAKAFTLPSAKACLSRRSFTIRIRRLPGVVWVSAVVKVRGKRVKTVKRSRITAPVNLKGLPEGRFSVTITATALDGRKVTGRRTYHTCTRKRTSPGPKL